MRRGRANRPPRDAIATGDPRAEPASGAIRSSLRALLAARDNRVALIVGALAGLVGGAIVFAALRERIGADFDAHVGFTAAGIRGDGVPGNFLLYVLNAVFAGFSADFWWLKLSLTIVLAAAVGAKVAVSIAYVATESRRELGLASSLPIWAAGLTALCAFAFSFRAGTAYVGQLPPNVWHNSTVILLMPFAVGLFWTSLGYLRDGERRWLWWSVPLVALNLAAKPSFVLAFLPVFSLVALLRWRQDRERLIGAALLVVATAALLGVQYAYIYLFDPTTTAGASGVVVDPLSVWEGLSADIPRSLLASYAFPLVALLLGGRWVWRNAGVRYALALAVVGLAEFALLAEDGFRRMHANFAWQAIVTNYVLFVAVVAALVPWMRSGRWDVRRSVAVAAIVAVLLAHVVAGVLYLDHWFTVRDFL